MGQLLSSILTKLFPTGCPKGFYGKHCRKKCHCANRGRCHRLYGACLCDPGLYGRFCHLGEFYYIRLYEWDCLLCTLSLTGLGAPWEPLWMGWLTVTYQLESYVTTMLASRYLVH